MLDDIAEYGLKDLSYVMILCEWLSDVKWVRRGHQSSLPLYLYYNVLGMYLVPGSGPSSVTVRPAMPLLEHPRGRKVQREHILPMNGSTRYVIM